MSRKNGIESLIYGNGLIKSQNRRESFCHFNNEMISVMRITNNAGKTKRILQYSPFGSIYEFGKTKDIERTPISFTGYECEENLNLLYAQARYYLPKIGRFAEEYSNKGNGYLPESLDYYMYCYNNSLSFVDFNEKTSQSIQITNIISSDSFNKLFGVYISLYEYIKKYKKQSKGSIPATKMEEEFFKSELNKKCTLYSQNALIIMCSDFIKKDNFINAKVQFEINQEVELCVCCIYKKAEIDEKIADKSIFDLYRQSTELYKKIKNIKYRFAIKSNMTTAYMNYDTRIAKVFASMELNSFWQTQVIILRVC